MYCECCLKQMLKKMTDIDIILLEKLLNANATLPQCSLSAETLSQDIEANSHQICTALNRLEYFGFTETQRWSRKNKYYITEDGMSILDILSKNLK